MYRIVMVACMYQEDAEAKKSRKKNAGNVAQSQLEDSLSIKDIVGNYRSVQVSDGTFISVAIDTFSFHTNKKVQKALYGGQHILVAIWCMRKNYLHAAIWQYQMLLKKVDLCSYCTIRQLKSLNRRIV